MNEIKRRSAIVVITSVLLLAVLALSTGIASAQEMTPEELFELLSGGWEFEGNMTIGEMTMPTIGTRTVILTDSTTADFVSIMEGEEEAETGEAWWNATMEKLAIKEGEEEPRYYDLLEHGYGATYELPEGIPELNISEPVFCEDNEIFIDENTTIKSFIATNATGVVVLEWEATFTRSDEWHMVEGISIQDAIDNADDGDTVIVHGGIYEEQLYIAKSVELRAAEGESPEIWAPEAETLKSYEFDLIEFTMPCLATPIIMVNGSSDDISVDISGFVVDGSSITLENSEYGISGIFYLNADGTIEENEIKNIWGENGDEENPVFPFPVNAWKVAVYSDSSNDVTIHRNNIHNYTGFDSIGIFIIGTGAKATVSENTVTGARSPDSHEQLGIAVAVDATATVRDNTITDFVYFDMRYYPSSIVINDASGTIAGNTIIGAGIWANEGWATSRSRTVSIKDNFVDASELSELSEMEPCGIAVSTYAYAYTGEEEPSITATIEGNQLIGVSGNGIAIGDISEHDPLGTITATITRNTVSGWECGIELLEQSNSTVYLNDFVDNVQNVFVNESTNVYNSTTEFDYVYDGEEYTNYLGNYWDDYEGEDADEDGIGDTPYNISSSDYCPLMETFESYSLVTHVYEGESIQEAINNASTGGMVIVHEGIYEEQLYIAKSVELRAAEGESPEILAPEPEEMEGYVYDFEMFPGFAMPMSVTPVIMVNGSSDDISVDITGFVINGISVTPETSEYGICGVAYLNADGTIESNEIKNIWGLTAEEGEPPYAMNGIGIFVFSSSDVTIHKNNIHNYTGVESYGIGIFGSGVKATVTENTITGARSMEFPDQIGIGTYNAIATVNDNIVSGHIYTEGVWYASGIAAADTNLTAQGNTLIGGGIWVNTGFGHQHSTAVIENNTVDASGVHEEECGPIAGIAITTFPKYGPYEGNPSVTATVKSNQLIGGPGSGIVIGHMLGYSGGYYFEPAGTVDATITRNTVSDWDYGIELLNCSNSTVYLNDFVNNTQNVFVNESTNVYNSPEKLDYTYEGRDYTSYLGNYWSDYEGEDANANGIGDTPYDINSSDDYPLMRSEENYEQIGILVVAHGSPEESWCRPVREAVENVSMGYPTEVGFLEFVSELESYNFIHEAVDKLDEQGVTKIIAVPLFISSHSGHIGEIEYVLGLCETLPGMSMMSSTLQETLPETGVISRTRTFVEGVEMERSVISREGRYYISYTPISEGISATGVSVMQHGGEEEELVPVDTTAEIVLTGAIDNHTLIAQILADRAAELCVNPENETVVFAAHGTYNETHFAGWVNSSESLAEKVKLILKYSKGIEIEDVRYSFVFANPYVHPDLVTRAVVENVSATSYPIVVPLMVSEGFFTSTYIPFMELAGLDYGYPESGKRTLTPHPNVANWAEVTAAKELTYPTIPIYNDSQLLDISIEDAGAYHGDICICLALGYRGTQLAIADLWDVYEGEMPHQGDFKVISASPTKGIRDAFAYIMNATGDDYVLDLPEGTDIVNLTQDNYHATIIRKSTGESVTIQVKEGVFPDGFFELRKKVKFGIPENATAEEKKAFKLLWTKTLEKAMYKPMDRVFEILPPEKEKVGILAIAHGSSSESWCAPIRDAVENVSWGYPIELGFLEEVPNETISDAVDNLDEENVTKIIAVPLFISSSSGHIAEIEYILGLRDTPPEGEEGLIQVNTTAEIVLTSAMDNHSLIAQILTDRAARLSVNATNETVVIVAHGTSTNETQFAGWNASSASLAEKVKLMLRHSKGHNIKDVRYSFVNVNATLHPELGVKTVVEDVSTTSYPIVVPLFISEGYWTNTKIPKLLKNLSHAYPEKGERAMTPHDNVPNWIEISAYKEFVEEFGYPTVQIYDGEELMDITTEDVGKYHGEGEIEICPCVVCAFRSTLRAFSEEELWGGIPHRGDVKIISAHPSDGHKMTFEYILNSTEDVVIELPPGTDIINITADNYVYTFINKTTNESITLRVKEDIFPERFFELRTKKKLGTATKEEKKALKLLWGKLREKAMYKPVEKVFEEV